MTPDDLKRIESLWKVPDVIALIEYVKELQEEVISFKASRILQAEADTEAMDKLRAELKKCGEALKKCEPFFENCHDSVNEKTCGCYHAKKALSLPILKGLMK